MKLFLPSLLLSFSLSFQVFSQDILIQGRVVDGKTSEPLAYAHLILEDVSLGTSTNKNGVYAFKVPEDMLYKKVRISYVGYRQESLPLMALQNETIALNPDLNSLDEVFISNLLRKTRTVLRPDWGKKVIGLGNLNGGLYPSILARFYERPKEFSDLCFLEEIQVHFFETAEQYRQGSKFRLHIYSVAPDGGPGKDLLKNYIVEKPAGRSKIKIDLLKERVLIPKHGFYVGLEHLFIAENQYEETKDFYLNDSLVAKDYAVKKYAPIYKGTLKEKDEIKMYYFRPEGWIPIENWDLSNDFFENKVPVTEFKIILTD